MTRKILPVFLGAVALCCLSACNTLDHRNATLSFRISAGRTLPVSKSASEEIVKDTNSFILTITDSGGNLVYDGPYGSRPQTLSVPADTYTIRLSSRVFDQPAFDSPVYGDELVVVAASGETVSVNFVCKMTASGVRVRMSGRYTDRYPGDLTVSQDFGQLAFNAQETRYGYFKAGNATFSAIAADGSNQTLFSKQLGEGNMLTISLDASDTDAGGKFTVKVDTTLNYISETVIVGAPGQTDGDGSRWDNACNILSAKNRVGETVWVWGYIVGGDMTTASVKFDGPFSKSSNIAIAPGATCRDREQCMSVELPSGSDARTLLNLVDNPSLLGARLWIKGTINASYMGLAGIKGATEFRLEE